MAADAPAHAARSAPGAPRLPLGIEDWITVLSMAALALITFLNVIVRYLTSSSFAWTEEISSFLLIVLTMSASSSAFVRRTHIRIELLADGGSARRRRRFALLTGALTFLFFAALTVLLARMAWDDYRWGDTSPAIGIPVWWYSAWLPLLGALIALRLLGIWLRNLRWRP